MQFLSRDQKECKEFVVVWMHSQGPGAGKGGHGKGPAVTQCLQQWPACRIQPHPELNLPPGCSLGLVEAPVPLGAGKLLVPCHRVGTSPPVLPSAHSVPADAAGPPSAAFSGRGCCQHCSTGAGRDLLVPCVHRHQSVTTVHQSTAVLLLLVPQGSCL